jgi:cysteine sulfinate desulfinase
MMDALGVKGTVRASFAVYNSLDDVTRLINAVEKAVDML